MNAIAVTTMASVSSHGEWDESGHSASAATMAPPNKAASTAARTAAVAASGFPRMKRMGESYNSAIVKGNGMPPAHFRVYSPNVVDISGRLPKAAPQGQAKCLLRTPTGRADP
jgi:hypothetical protein